jgi:hypothetical protein
MNTMNVMRSARDDSKRAPGFTEDSLAFMCETGSSPAVVGTCRIASFYSIRLFVKAYAIPVWDLEIMLAGIVSLSCGDSH